MISDNARRFDLYDFFSVLLPGVALLLSVVPFLPKDTDLNAIGALLPILVGGFVFGRAVHTLAVGLEDNYQASPTHRERFIQELSTPDILNEETLQAFYDECTETFDFLDEEYPWEQGGDERNKAKLEDLYGIVRSYIHIDSRGRSRTFQAIYSFYRSMWIVSILVAAMYFLYGLLKGSGTMDNIVTFTSFLGSLEIPPGLLVLSSAIVALASYRAFSEARADYQKHFIRYLFADFLVIQGVDYPETFIRATVSDEETSGGP